MEGVRSSDYNRLAESGFEGYLSGVYDHWLSCELEGDDVRNRLERKPVIMPDTLAAADDRLEAIKANQSTAFEALIVAVADRLIGDTDRSEALRVLKKVTGRDYSKFLKAVEERLVAGLRALGVDVEGLIAQQPETVRRITGKKVLDALLGLLPCVKAAEKLKRREALVPRLAERTAESLDLHS